MTTNIIEHNNYYGRVVIIQDSNKPSSEQVTRYYLNGIIEATGTMLYGKEDGLWVGFHRETGKISWETMYDNGDEIWNKTYTKTGKLRK
jgi:antitoxin component YwqK of YwqJK toxin-antitoxin module